MASDSKLVPILKQLGYTAEYVKKFDGTFDYGTMVVEFPVHIENAIYAKDMTAIKQLELVKQLQGIWADNSISVTVYYRKEELDEIREWLKDNYQYLKTVSFLLHSDHGFEQAPYEEITRERYLEIMNDVQEITPGIIQDLGEWFDSDCAGACPVR